MIKNYNQNSPAMDRALKNLEQAKARYEEERKKENEKRRKAENHHKYMMGGIIVKYFRTVISMNRVNWKPLSKLRS